MRCHPPDGPPQCTQLCECTPVALGVLWRWFNSNVGRSWLCADRYIVSQPHVMRTVDIVRALRERFPGLVVPNGAEVPLTINIDSSKVRWTLGCR